MKRRMLNSKLLDDLMLCTLNYKVQSTFFSLRIITKFAKNNLMHPLVLNAIGIY